MTCKAHFSEPLNLLSPLPERLFPQLFEWPALSPHQCLPTNTTSSERSSLNTLTAIYFIALEHSLWLYLTLYIYLLLSAIGMSPWTDSFSPILSLVLRVLQDLGLLFWSLQDWSMPKTSHLSEIIWSLLHSPNQNLWLRTVIEHWPP